MKKKMCNSTRAKTTSLMVLLVSVFLLSALAGVQFVGKVSAAGAYDWPMFCHDLQHTGYSASPAPNTNQILWDYTINSGVASSPAVADGKVYVGSYDNKVYCLNAATGAHIWNYTTGGTVPSSPAVFSGRVYVGSSDGNVYCFNATTGAHIWTYNIGGAVFSSPAVGGGRVYVGSYLSNVYCLNAYNGTHVWNYTTGGAVTSSPAVFGNKVYVGSNDNKVHCLNATTGAHIWSYPTGYFVSSSPAVVDGKVYLGSYDNNVYCLNAETGAYVWSYTTGDIVTSSPAVVDGKVYVGSWDSNVYCLDAATGAYIWAFPTTSSVLSSPAVADGKVYVGSNDNNMYCLDATNGAHIWSYTTGGAVTSSAVANGVVYVGSNGKVYAFSAGPPITRAITLTPTAQAPDASVTIDGTGFGVQKPVGIGFGAEVNVTNEIMNVTGPFDTDTGPYTSCVSHVPIKPGTFRKSENLSGPIYTLVDIDAGDGTFNSPLSYFVNGTINYVTGQYTLYTSLIISSSPHLVHLCNYTYYQYNVTPAAGATTGPSGTLTAAITVPTVANGNYAVTAIDTQGHLAVATLSVDDTIPEGLTIGVMVLLSSVAVIVSTRYFRKRPKIEN